MKPTTQEELDMFFLPTDGTAWDQEIAEYHRFMEELAGDFEYASWLDTLNELHKEER